MRTAVVTITHRRDRHLHRQRAGLAAGPPDLHVVVGMGEEPRLAAVRGAPPTRMLCVPLPAEGLPLAAARNAGAEAARAAGAELLVWLDVDCIPDPRLLPRYAEAAGGVPRRPALLCGPVGYLPPAPPGGYPPDGLGELAVAHPARPVPAADELRAEDRFELFWSLSFALTTGDWERLGGFCEDYVGYGGEDTDFAMSAAAAGARMYWVGGAWAYHQHHPSTRTAPGQVEAIVRNARTFHDRWGWWPMSGWLTELAEAGTVEFDPARDVLRIR
ncbi:glycosyltransferase family 2 protein [Pseudonocardia acidicola]|uniref:Glycosyltransferase family 2 protein n=1 Tax=Pseudonocardia acidicola TaxID=2724939 RepID=A0ABX1S7T6_9PSEU|nr:galactosyltransferase-related protein [Pseudonocardia acidicola]NMH96974.1 glycosyltransferase family 2 protein [Pseudonocardia acidicola]